MGKDGCTNWYLSRLDKRLDLDQLLLNSYKLWTDLASKKVNIIFKDYKKHPESY